VTVSKHVAVRVDLDTLARIDALVPGLSSSWHKAKRSDALRLLIVTGLDTIEARSERKPPLRKRRK
jgi:hypothetical protein